LSKSETLFESLPAFSFGAIYEPTWMACVFSSLLLAFWYLFARILNWRKRLM